MRKFFLHTVYLASLLLFFSCGSEGTKTKTSGDEISGDLIVFHAGSLSVPFKEMAEAFEKEHPSVNVQLEAAGSVACARKITDLDRECDVFGSADYKVIDELLIPEYTDWNLQFAGNEISIVYTEKSRLADKINSENWYEILQDKNVAYGRSDPNSDPCGYRTEISLKLAEKVYQIDGLANRLLAKDKKHIRPKASDLIALLELGAIDYMFEYTSVAIQHKFKYIGLPDSINLSNPNLANWYRQVSTEINGKKPGDKITFYGEPIVYGATILRDTPNPKAALEFMKFIVSPDKGLAIMKKSGQTVMDPPVSEQMGKVPDGVIGELSN